LKVARVLGWCRQQLIEGKAAAEALCVYRADYPLVAWDLADRYLFEEATG
jgi:hypothetical protein